MQSSKFCFKYYYINKIFNKINIFIITRERKQNKIYNQWFALLSSSKKAFYRMAKAEN